MTDTPADPALEELQPEAPLPPPAPVVPSTPEERVDEQVRVIVGEWRLKRRAARDRVERLQTELRQAKGEVAECEAIIARLKGFIGDEEVEVE